MKSVKFITLLSIIIFIVSCKEKEEAPPIKFNYVFSEGNYLKISRSKKVRDRINYKISNPDNHSYRFKLTALIIDQDRKSTTSEIPVKTTTDSYLEYEAPVIHPKGDIRDVKLTLIVNIYPAYNDEIEILYVD